MSYQEDGLEGEGSSTYNRCPAYYTLAPDDPKLSAEELRAATNDIDSALSQISLLHLADRRQASYDADAKRIVNLTFKSRSVFDETTLTICETLGVGKPLSEDIPFQSIFKDDRQIEGLYRELTRRVELFAGLQSHIGSSAKLAEFAEQEMIWWRKLRARYLALVSGVFHRSCSRISCNTYTSGDPREGGRDTLLCDRCSRTLEYWSELSERSDLPPYQKMQSRLSVHYALRERQASVNAKVLEASVEHVMAMEHLLQKSKIRSLLGHEYLTREECDAFSDETSIRCKAVTGGAKNSLAFKSISSDIDWARELHSSG